MLKFEMVRPATPDDAAGRCTVAFYPADRETREWVLARPSDVLTSATRVLHGPATITNLGRVKLSAPPGVDLHLLAKMVSARLAFDFGVVTTFSVVDADPEDD